MKIVNQTREGANARPNIEEEKKNTQSIHRFQFYIVPVNPTLFLCVSLALALVLSRIRRGAHTSMRRAQ